jgi:hypothetical protein
MTNNYFVYSLIIKNDNKRKGELSELKFEVTPTFVNSALVKHLILPTELTTHHVDHNLYSSSTYEMHSCSSRDSRDGSLFAEGRQKRALNSKLTSSAYTNFWRVHFAHSHIPADP